MKTLEQDQEGKLEFVLAFYTNENMVYLDYDSKKRKLINPQSLTIENYTKIQKFFQQKKENEIISKILFDGFIPKNVLHYKEDSIHIIWETPMQIKKHIFKNDEIESGNYPVPNLIWKFTDGKLYIHAIKENDDRLYQAPFLNTYSDGSICLGSIKFKFKKNTYEEVIRVVENNFFNSYFTHTNTTNLIQGNLVEFYKNHKNKSIFPEELLVLTNRFKKDLL